MTPKSRRSLRTLLDPHTMNRLITCMALCGACLVTPVLSRGSAAPGSPAHRRLEDHHTSPFLLRDLSNPARRNDPCQQRRRGRGIRNRVVRSARSERVLQVGRQDRKRQWKEGLFGPSDAAWPHSHQLHTTARLRRHVCDVRGGRPQHLHRAVRSTQGRRCLTGVQRGRPASKLRERRAPPMSLIRWATAFRLRKIETWVHLPEATLETLYDRRRSCLRTRRIAPIVTSRHGMGNHDQPHRHPILGQRYRVHRGGDARHHAST